MIHSGKLGYKTFEYICDLQREAFRLRTQDAQQALDAAQDAYSWPWCLTQAQANDWNVLYARLDPDEETNS